MFWTGLFLLLAAILEPSPGGGATTVLEIVYSEAGGSESGTQARRIFLESKRIRIDTFEHSATAPTLTILFHADPQVLFVVDHAGEECLRIEREAVEARAEQLQSLRRQLQQQLAQIPPAQREMVEQMMADRGLQAQPARGPVPQIQSTADMEEIAGYQCRKYQIIHDGKVSHEFCITPWSELGVDEASVRTLNELTAFVDELMISFGERLTLGRALRERFLVDLDIAGGFPVLLRTLQNQKIVSEEVLRSVGETPTAVVFDIPDGYRQSELDTSAPLRE